GPDGSNFIGNGSFMLAHTTIDGAVSVSGPGVVALDPAFVDPDGADGVPGTLDDDLRLLPGSPAIDAGDTGALPIGAMLDALGGVRTIDGDHDGVATVDLGAIEARCPGDATGDGLVDFADLNATLTMFGAGTESGADRSEERRV